MICSQQQLIKEQIQRQVEDLNPLLELAEEAGIQVVLRIAGVGRAKDQAPLELTIHEANHLTS